MTQFSWQHSSQLLDKYWTWEIDVCLCLSVCESLFLCVSLCLWVFEWLGRCLTGCGCGSILLNDLLECFAHKAYHFKDTICRPVSESLCVESLCVDDDIPTETHYVYVICWPHLEKYFERCERCIVLFCSSLILHDFGQTHLNGEASTIYSVSNFGANVLGKLPRTLPRECGIANF